MARAEIKPLLPEVVLALEAVAYVEKDVMGATRRTIAAIEDVDKVVLSI